MVISTMDFHIHEISTRLDGECAGNLIKDRSIASILTAPVRTFRFLLLKQLTQEIIHPKFNCTFQIMISSYCISLHFCINNSPIPFNVLRSTVAT